MSYEGFDCALTSDESTPQQEAILPFFAAELLLHALFVTTYCSTGRSGRAVIASGWESKGSGFKAWYLHSTFDPSLPNLTNNPSLSVSLMIKFAWCT